MILLRTGIVMTIKRNSHHDKNSIICAAVIRSAYEPEGLFPFFLGTAAAQSFLRTWLYQPAHF